MSQTLDAPSKLLIMRRRMGWTQKRAAQHHRVKLNKYRSWELGTANGVPKVKLGALREHEKCYVQRMCAGMTLKQLAKRMRMSQFWVNSMELGKAPVDALKEFWDQN